MADDRDRYLTWPPALADDDLGGGTEPGHRFCWAAVSELHSVRFEPADLARRAAGPG
jgi:hypothetical protein